MFKNKVSLILTTYNCKELLKKTLKSIEEQTYPYIEVVIIDGASTDGTVEVIREYANMHGEKVIWLSEKDQGIYDALNKGVERATGDYIEVMNDRYTRCESLETLVKAAETFDGACIGVHADLVYCEGDEVKRYWKMGQGKIISGWMPGHPSLLLKREVYEKYGLYDIQYTCSADYEFMLRFLKNRTNQLAYVPEVLISMYYGGTSTATTGSYLVSLKESYHGLRKNKIKFAGWICFMRIVRVLLQFVKMNKSGSNFLNRY